ncbi:MAG: hypothetical protein A2887_03035 [Alphaproteobacteria bacterium RIFCSPLOWO2_01_FULL_40_26]|nr:MAG: hypothetical protein A3D15_05625 [Alphaproteobacteria bacterium RIFCSPHIGHO2_02_FULL_40_34]OFW86966.1 MAG: hypothetical protein A2794_01305 [Alphaproteobacteria bacterium RIFCSPHIGHO2_01_FULL_40_8]OFW95498.1 MAG: hypothetical protein A2887_03035 [Alphaproteobacteria bacterium RIFCSPLOWO2_01_FULL_40_26]OFX09322.1 MAG: hypothetical protein A3H30_01295 [Alphaproteobacteria bacterium RIFCSPLOWO2_02_FULL_40_19]OFX10857.1 MAG: hypothetical protein A3G22_00325 [Alphaproteobacteria bacterium RI
MFGNQQIDQEILVSYNIYFSDLRKKRLKIVILLALLFIALFGILDLTLYPQTASTLIKSRIVFDAILTAYFLAIFYRPWIKNMRFAVMLVIITILTQINILIFITHDGATSPYYAGLTLAIVAITIVIPYTFFETCTILLSCLVLYFLTLIVDHQVHGTPYHLPLLVNNLFFLISTNTFCIVASYLNVILRFNEFRINFDLRTTLGKLKTAQAQLVHSERISAVGNLSAGLLHEVNNPLNYAITALQVMKMDPNVSSDADLKETAADIENGMMRIKNIITDLRAFAYPQEADRQFQFKIHEAIESTMRFTAHETEDIEKIVNVPQDLMVRASKSHIVQVLINLITNADKAINKAKRENGKIIISTKQENDRVIVSVSDNGIGMNEETLQKIFDPFFTTSEIGKGLGLGLSVSHTIIKNHNGNLAAKSVLGEGSEFYFDLPI